MNESRVGGSLHFRGLRCLFDLYASICWKTPTKLDENRAQKWAHNSKRVSHLCGKWLCRVRFVTTWNASQWGFCQFCKRLRRFLVVCRLTERNLGSKLEFHLSTNENWLHRFGNHFGNSISRDSFVDCFLLILFVENSISLQLDMKSRHILFAIEKMNSEHELEMGLSTSQNPFRNLPSGTPKSRRAEPGRVLPSPALFLCVESPRLSTMKPCPSAAT